MLKQKRKEKAGKWSVPLPKVKGIEEAEVFKVLKTGKRKSKYLGGFGFLVFSFGFFVLYINDWYLLEPNDDTIWNDTY